MRLRGSLSEALHEDIVARDSLCLLVRRGLSALDVRKHLELLPFEVHAVGLCDSFDRILLFAELHVGEPTGESVGIAFELALLDLAELGVQIEDLLLGKGGGQVADQNVGLGVGLVLSLLQRHSNDLVLNDGVVERLLAL